MKWPMNLFGAADGSKYIMYICICFDDAARTSLKASKIAVKLQICVISFEVDGALSNVNRQIFSNEKLPTAETRTSYNAVAI